MGKPQKDRKAIAQAVEDDYDNGGYMDSNEPSDNEDGESLKKILSLVGAQFSKKSSDRAKRSENEHIQQLESKRSELAKDIGKSAALHQEKIDSLKRELSLHVEEFAGSAKKIKVGMEKSLEANGANITRLEMSLKESMKTRQGFFTNMETMQATQQDEVVKAIKTMKKEIQATKQAVFAALKDPKEAQTIQAVFATAMNI